MANSFVNCILFRVVLAVTLNHFFGIVGLYTACMLAPAISVFSAISTRNPGSGAGLWHNSPSAKRRRNPYHGFRLSLSINVRANAFGGRKGVDRTKVLREPSGFLQEK